jgi:AcrR family transcriptional regulator
MKKVENNKKDEISQGTIVRTAIALLNRDGLEKLTMRALAGALEIKAASLYWHIRNKQELLDLIAEQVSSEIKPASGLSNSKKYITESAGLWRQKLLGLRDSVDIFIQSPPKTPIRVELIKNIIISLLHLGIKEQNCMVAAGMFNNYVLSFVGDEMRMRAAINTTGALPEDAVNPFSHILGSGYKPLTFNEQFNRGLDVLFAGFKILE